ncbi:MAG: hypothetical protein AB1896_17880, partial [Thermodesulfobacteriota bacterium]
MTGCDFTFHHYRRIFETALEAGYRVLTLQEFFSAPKEPMGRVLINRVDVDLRLDRIQALAGILDDLGVKATFFLRLHADRYNLLSFNGFNMVKALIRSGHEIGLHSEL